MTKSLQSESSKLAMLVADVRSTRRQFPNQDAWPAEILRVLWEAQIPNWFIPRGFGGDNRSGKEILELYLELGSACLTSTFILTQFAGAVRRIAAMADVAMAAELLDDIRRNAFVTVGISQLTTSRRHQGTPPLRVATTPGGFRIDGYSPWVTGASHARWIVAGAHLADGQSSLFVVPMATQGVQWDPPQRLLALNGSHTGSVQFDGVAIKKPWRIDPPGSHVDNRGGLATTGGLQTSALALALARSALDYLFEQSANRPTLTPIERHLRGEWDQLVATLLRTDDDALTPAAANEMRTQANQLVLRATQAALTAAKGAGFLEGHDAGRWCREALFFLVWSCPPEVVQSHLCEFAGILA